MLLWVWCSPVCCVWLDCLGSNALGLLGLLIVLFLFIVFICVLLLLCRCFKVVWGVLVLLFLDLSACDSYGALMFNL